MSKMQADAPQVRAHEDVHILLVEDDQGDVLLVRESLAGHPGVLIHVIPDGAEALMFLRQAEGYAAAPRPDLILLDLNLPGKHGLEVLAELRSDHELASIPVVMLSSSRNPDEVRRSYLLNADAYVVKPLDLDDFAAAITSIYSAFVRLAQRRADGVPPDDSHRMLDGLADWALSVRDGDAPDPATAEVVP